MFAHQPSITPIAGCTILACTSSQSPPRTTDRVAPVHDRALYLVREPLLTLLKGALSLLDVSHTHSNHISPAVARHIRALARGKTLCPSTMHVSSISMDTIHLAPSYYIMAEHPELSPVEVSACFTLKSRAGHERTVYCAGLIGLCLESKRRRQRTRAHARRVPWYVASMRFV